MGVLISAVALSVGDTIYNETPGENWFHKSTLLSHVYHIHVHYNVIL